MSGIAQWARLRAEWLSQVLSLHGGKAPCANTYQYVCDHMDKSVLEAEIEAFTAEIAANKAAKSAGKPRKWRQLAIDGKALRGTDRQVAPGREAHMVMSVYVVGTRRVCNHHVTNLTSEKPRGSARRQPECGSSRPSRWKQTKWEQSSFTRLLPMALGATGGWTAACGQSSSLQSSSSTPISGMTPACSACKLAITSIWPAPSWLM